MLHSYRERLAEPLILGAYAGMLGMGWHVGARDAQMLALLLTAVLAFAAWVMSFRRWRAMSDTPTSRIASAAQGYVELVGQGRNLPEFPVLSHLTQLPCLWYRYTVDERTSNNKWKRVAAGRSAESFVIEDGSGQCLVDPEHAEVISSRKNTWYKDDFRYTEWLILPQDRVYLLGEFVTIGGSNVQLDLKQDVADLLAEWKRNRPQLLARFDLDRDGEIGEDEWLLARSQARRDVSRRHNEIRTQPGTHMVQKPRDGRLFLIANDDPSKLARRYRNWAWLHLAVFLGAAGWFFTSAPM